MEKRGQIYILVAILLGFVIYLLATTINVVKTPTFDNSFISISDNYDKESGKFLTFLNQELLRNDETDVPKEFNQFTGKFTSYSRVVSSGFGFIYFFDYSHGDTGKLIIGNHLDQEILVWFDENNKVIMPGCKSKIQLGVGFGELSSKFISDPELMKWLTSCSKVLSLTTIENTYNISYVVGNIKYTSSVIKGIPQIVILSEERNNNERKVYTNHKFVKGENWIEELKIYCNSVLLTPKPIICTCDLRMKENDCLINDYCRWDDKTSGCVVNE